MVIREEDLSAARKLGVLNSSYYENLATKNLGHISTVHRIESSSNYSIISNDCLDERTNISADVHTGSVAGPGSQSSADAVYKKVRRGKFGIVSEKSVGRLFE